MMRGVLRVKDLIPLARTIKNCGPQNANESFIFCQAAIKIKTHPIIKPERAV